MRYFVIFICTLFAITNVFAAGNLFPPINGVLPTSNLPSFTVQTNAALKNLSVGTIPNGYVVNRLGFANSGDGGQQIYVFSTTTCTISGGDNGTQVLPNSGTGCWNAANGPMSVLAWGADKTGTIDSTAAMNYAFNQSYGRKITIPCGTYNVRGASAGASAIIVNTAYVQVHGEGQGCTIIRNTSSAGDTLHINTNMDQYFVSDIQFDRTVASGGSGAGVMVDDGHNGRLERLQSQNNWYGFSLGPTDRSYCDQCLAQYNYSDGFYLFDLSTHIHAQWQMINSLSQQNDGWGFNHYFVGNSTFNDTDPYYDNPNTYNNTLGGYLFDGSVNSAHNDLIMQSPVASTDGGNGYQFTRPGTNNIINNIFSELGGTSATGRLGTTAATHSSNCINFDTGGRTDSIGSSIQINGGHLVQCSLAGLNIYSNSNLGHIGIINVESHNNGTSNNGFTFSSASTKIRISGATAYGQAYGLNFQNSTALSNAIIVGSDFTGNTTAGCNVTLTNKSAVLGSSC